MNSDELDKIIQTEMPGFELVKEETRQPAAASIAPDSKAPSGRVWKKFGNRARATTDASNTTPARADSNAPPAIEDLRTKFIGRDRGRRRARPQTDGTSESGAASYSTADRSKTILRHIRPIGTTDSDPQSPNTKAILIKDGKIYSSQG